MLDSCLLEIAVGLIKNLPILFCWRVENEAQDLGKEHKK
jgi:hypothetical protein